MNTVAVVLAAGLGKRMKSSIPKVLHPILGDPSLLWVLRALPASVRHAVVVMHHGRDQVESALCQWQDQGLLPCPVTPVDQGEPLGTGHALQRAAATLDRLQAERVLILCGDVPLVRRTTLQRLLTGPAALLALDLEDPTGYGRVLQDPDGHLSGIVEEKDASPAQREVRRVNSGTYALPWPPLRAALAGLSNANAQGEYYLTDAVAALAQAQSVQVELGDADELAGMNSRADQAALAATARAKLNAAWMEAGVTLADPATTFIGPRVRLGRDVYLEPGVLLEGEVTAEDEVRIGLGCVIRDTHLGAGTQVRPHSVLDGARAGADTRIGPFARLREGTVLEAGVHVGNYVETKQALLRSGVKANHLTYLGDCEVGPRTNVGAGCITCNYDGFSKHRTLIGADVFVGSDCQMVAPLSIGDGAVLGAGTTLTADVAPGALVLTRAPLVQKEGGAERLRAKLREVKARRDGIE